MATKKLYAVVTAAGSSSRMNSAVPKPLLKLETQSGVISVLRLSVERLAAAAHFEGIVVTAPEKYLSHFKRDLEGINPNPCVINGGATRQQSVHAALEFIQQELAPDEQGLVLIHDAARCFVSESIVQAVIKAADTNGAATAGLPVVDALAKVDGEGIRNIDRNGLISIQTPQAFRLREILSAHRAAKSQGREALDDAALVERFSVVPGERINFKITEASDFELANLIAKSISV